MSLASCTTRHGRKLNMPELRSMAASYPKLSPEKAMIQAVEDMLGLLEAERDSVIDHVKQEALTRGITKSRASVAKLEKQKALTPIAPARQSGVSTMSIVELEDEAARIMDQLADIGTDADMEKRLLRRGAAIQNRLQTLERKTASEVGSALLDAQIEAEIRSVPQDSSNGTAETVPAVKTALQTAATGDDLLRIVRRNGDVLDRMLVKVLEAIGVGKLTVLYEDRVETDKGKRVLGQHYDGEVRIFRGGENSRVIIHELFHGVTVAQLERARQALKLTDKERTALIAGNPELGRYIRGYERLTVLMEEANQKLGLNFTDVLEFVSEAMSDPELQYSLIHTRSGMSALSPSLWQKITKAIADMYQKVMAQLKETRNITPEDFDASMFARVMESTALVSAEGYAGKPFNRVQSNSTAGTMGLTSPADPFRPQVSLQSVANALVDGDWQLSAKEALRLGADKVRGALEWAMTQRGLSMAHPAFRAVKERITDMIADKENILTAMNEKMQRFLKEFRDPRVREMVADMLRSSTLLHTTEELPDALAAKIVAAVHDHMARGKQIYDIDPDTKRPTLAKHIRDLGVMLPKEAFVKGVPISNEGTVVKLADGKRDANGGPLDAAATALDNAYAGYESAMETLILGHLERLEGAKNRAAAMTARDELQLLREYAPTVVDALTTMRTMYDAAYGRLSTIDVKKRRVMQKESATDVTLERVAKVLQGMLSGKEEAKGAATSSAAIAKTLGVTEAELAKLLAPLQAEVSRLPKEKQSKMAGKFRDQIIAGAEPTQLVESEALTAMQSLLTMYVPIRRYGKYSMALRLINEKGENVSGTVMVPQVNRDTGEVTYTEKKTDVVLDLWQHDNLTALQAAHAKLTEQLASEGPVEVKVGDAVVKAKLAWDRPVRTNEFRTASTRIRPAEFFSYAETIGIQLDPKQRAKVIKASTNADAAARTKLERKGVPGYSTDFVRAISDHSGAVASLVAIRKHEEVLQELVSNGENWKWTAADQARLDAAKTAYEAAPNPEAKDIAKRAYDQINMDYQQVNNLSYGTPRMADIRQQAQELLDYVLGSDQIEDNQNFVTKLRAVTTVMQLGGTLASPFTNLTSLPLHTFSYLATYNPERAFGGGFGGMAAAGAIARAAKAMGPILKRSAMQLTGKEVFFPEEKFREMEKLAKEQGGTYNGYSVAHWEYLRKASAEGILTAQKFNDLLAQRKHSQFSPKTAKAVSQYMAVFAATEEYNRLVTGLASFDLFYQQAKVAGMSEAAASEHASAQARKAVFATQGEYNMGNRPKLFRSDIGSLVFLYKTFVVITLELLRNLPPKGRAIFLGSLYAMSGAGGIPLWEELMLVMDVVAQKTGLGLGITKGNAEREFAAYMKDMGKSLGWEKLDEVVLRGVFDTYLGTEILGRAGVSVGVPGIGMLKPGANFMEEVGRTLGAVGGAVEGAEKAVGKVVRGDVEGALRALPITGVKNFADAYTYTKYDAVMNKRGQVVTQGPGAFDVFARVLGFYPEEMKWVGDQVRREEYTRAFAKELKGAITEEYREAYVLHDAARKAELQNMVREHNAIFRGTALEITNFVENAERAGKEAALTLRERAQKTLPKAQQRDSALVE